MTAEADLTATQARVLRLLRDHADDDRAVEVVHQARARWVVARDRHRQAFAEATLRALWRDGFLELEADRGRFIHHDDGRVYVVLTEPAA